MPNHTVSTNVDTMLRAADNAAIRTAIGVGTTDSPTLGGITIGTGNAKLQYTPGGNLTVSRVSDGGQILVVNADANNLAMGSILTDTIRNRFTGANGATLEFLGSGVLEQRNGATAQAFRIYNTYTDASNYERLSFNYFGGGGCFRINPESAGTGVIRSLMLDGGAQTLELGTNGTFRWRVSNAGHFLAASDNAYDIGASGANRPRAGYFGTSISAAGTFINNNSYSFAGFRLFGNSAGNILLDSNGGSAFFMQFGGQGATAPAIKRNGTGIDIRLADDSAYAPLIAGSLGLGTANPVADLDIADTWNAPAITVTGASGNGTTATITFATQATAIQVGAKIVVASVNPTGYNGTFVVTASTVTSMSYANATTTAWVSGGTVQRQFDSVKINATDTASDPNSNLIDLQVNAVSKARITKYGTFIGPESGVSKSPVVAFPIAGSYAVGIWSPAPYTIQFAMSAANGLNDTTSYNGMQYEMTTATLSWGASISQDIKLSRDAAGILAQRNGTNAQAFRLYNTTDAGLTNFERVNLEWSGGLAILQTVKGGTGTDRSLVLRSASELFFGVAGGSQWKIDGNAHFLAVTDNQRDIGASNANRPRSIYAGTSVECGTTSYIGWTGRAKIYSPSGSNNVIQLLNNAANDFNLLLLGLANSAFPAIKRNGAGIQIRLADDSANAALESGNFTSTGTIKPERATLTTSATSVTLDISHAGTVLIVTNASPITVTLPTASSVGVGYNVMVIQGGAGAITFAAGAGNTLNSFGALVTSAGQHAAAGIVCTASNIYNLSGNLT